MSDERTVIPRLSVLEREMQNHVHDQRERWARNDERWREQGEYLREFREERKQSVAALHRRVDDVGTSVHQLAAEVRDTFNKALWKIILVMASLIGGGGAIFGWLLVTYVFPRGHP